MEGGSIGEDVVEPTLGCPIAPTLGCPITRGTRASPRSPVGKGGTAAAGSGADGSVSGEGLELGLVTAAFREQLPILLPKERFKMSPIQRILWMITHLPRFLTSLQSSSLIAPSLGSPRLL